MAILCSILEQDTVSFAQGELVHANSPQKVPIEQMVSGTKVQARWVSEGEYCRGTIKTANTGKTFDIAFDDGDVRNSCPIDEILLPMNPGEVFVARVESHDNETVRVAWWDDYGGWDEIVCLDQQFVHKLETAHAVHQNRIISERTTLMEKVLASINLHREKNNVDAHTMQSVSVFFFLVLTQELFSLCSNTLL